MLAKHKHPDPYILSWRPGGTSYHRNPPPVPEVISLSVCVCVCVLGRSYSPLTIAMPGVCLQMCAQLPFSQ